jgi:hypothetical protein
MLSLPLPSSSHYIPSPGTEPTHVKVLAVHTLADLCAEDASLEALAVLLEAGALLAVAALGVAYSAVWRVADALGVCVTLSSLTRRHSSKHKKGNTGTAKYVSACTMSKHTTKHSMAHCHMQARMPWYLQHNPGQLQDTTGQLVNMQHRSRELNASWWELHASNIEAVLLNTF